MAWLPRGTKSLFLNLQQIDSTHFCSHRSGGSITDLQHLIKHFTSASADGKTCLGQLCLQNYILHHAFARIKMFKTTF